MKTAHWRWFLVLVVPAALAGCNAGPVDRPAGSGAQPPKAAGDPDEEAKIQAALAQLDPADRKLAEGQRFCAIENDKRLGSMGKPAEVMVNDQPVFLCCIGCRKKALANPDKTLARVQELRAQTESAPAK